MLRNRVHRLERNRPPMPDDGLPHCGVCRNGAERQLVVRFESEAPFPPLPTCQVCGRELAFLISYRLAEPPHRPEAPA